MKHDGIFARRSALAAGLLAAGSVLALSPAAGAACTPSAGDDVCEVTAATNPPGNENFAAAGTDKLSLAGAANFTFDLAQIGAGLLGLDAFEKTGASDVTLTGAPTGANAANNWSVLAGRLIADAGANFQNTANVSVDAGAEFLVRTTNETIASLTNAGKVTVETGVRLITGGDTTVQTGGELTGLFSLGGDLNNSGAFNGQGNLGIASSVAGNATNNAGGVLSGNLVIFGNLTNLGTLNPGASPGAVSVFGNYTGGGLINAEVDFDSVTTPAPGPVPNGAHDFLSIGGTATGVTTIAVTNFPAPNAANPDPTTGNGIELVRIAGNSAANAFRLAGPVLQGGFQYVLERVGANNAAASYFLQSTVREELHANAVALAAGRTTVRALAFADRGVEAAEGIGAKIRAWLTVHGGTEQAGESTGTRFNSNFWGVTAGVDTGFTSNVRVGVQGGYGQTDADLFLRQGSPSLEGETWFGQVYAQFVSGQWFADASVGYASTEWDFRRSVMVAGFAPRLTDTVDGVIGKVGGGYRFQFDEPFAVTVQAHAIYDGTSCGDNCFLSGNREKTNDWFGKASVRFERPYDDGRIRPYLQVSYTDDFDDGARVQFGQALAVSDTSNSILGVNAGVALDVAPNMHVFLDAGLTRSLDNDVQGYQGQAGFRMTW